MTPQDPKLEWRAQNVPVSLRFDDSYYLLESGFEERKHMFLNVNSLPERLHDRFSIAKLGFSTGLNFLTLLDSWRRIDRPGLLLFTSFEAFPLSAADMIKAQAAFPILQTLSAEFTPIWETLLTTGQIETTDITLRLVQGDARLSLPLWQGQRIVGFLTGFQRLKTPTYGKRIFCKRCITKLRQAAAPAPIAPRARYGAIFKRHCLRWLDCPALTTNRI